MRVRHERGGGILLQLTEPERALVVELSEELTTLLSAPSTLSPEGAVDPARRRLVPDAYRDDADASAEFRRFTEDELTTAKQADASAVADAARRDGDIRLDRTSVVPWLRSLTDLRLVLAERLGIHVDGDVGDYRAEAAMAHQVYQWLGEMQGWILQELDG